VENIINARGVARRGKNQAAGVVYHCLIEQHGGINATSRGCTHLAALRFAGTPAPLSGSAGVQDRAEQERRAAGLPRKTPVWNDRADGRRGASYQQCAKIGEKSAALVLIDARRCRASSTLQNRAKSLNYQHIKRRDAERTARRINAWSGVG